MTLRIVTHPITRAQLTAIAAEQFGDLVKAVVDAARGIMVIGGELQAPEEGIEFDSLINVRPSRGNRSRGVEDPVIRAKIVEIVGTLVSR